MITGVKPFADYFEGIRSRTLRFLDQIPPDQIDFAPHPGKFTLGDLVRHLASTEAMFTGAVLQGEWAYRGHGRKHGASLEEALRYLKRTHEDCMARLRAAPDDLLRAKRPTLHGYPVSAWHLLMAMAEHEAHHRSQVSQYLVALGVEPPQVFGLKIEQVGSDS
ncbi:MAG: DinB family protein [Bacillota bacterium]